MSPRRSPTENSVGRRRRQRHRGLTPQRRNMPALSPPRDLVFSSDEEDAGTSRPETKAALRTASAAEAKAAAATPVRSRQRRRHYTAAHSPSDTGHEEEKAGGRLSHRTPRAPARGPPSRAADTPGDSKTDFIGVRAPVSAQHAQG